MTAAPVLEVGGTHVSAVMVETTSWRPLPATLHRLPLDSNASADAVLTVIAAAVRGLGPLPGSVLAVAVPGPFDYDAGIGRFRDVGKFDALDGVDVRSELLARLDDPPAAMVFLNDASAFGLGEWARGAGDGDDRIVAITLGTGVGSAFVRAGRIVSTGPEVPPAGSVHLLRIGALPLEDVVSRRAIICSYDRWCGRKGEAGLDVDGIARRALDGEAAAERALGDAFHALGGALAPWLARFGARRVVVGGGMAASWSLVEPPLRAGIDRWSRQHPGPLEPDDVTLLPSPHPEDSTAVGAAWYAATSQPSTPRRLTGRAGH